MRSILVAVAVTALLCAIPTPITAKTHHHHHPKVGTTTPTEVEWTFLLFLNGNNNLDTWGTFNVQQMITVGSQPWLNIVVQQASLSKNDTQRLYITKGNAQVVQDLGAGVQMGDVSTWEDFLQWGVTNYPAKHYFVSIWDHGTGWHYVRGASTKPQLGDISCNDDFDRCISTTQLGDALARFKRIIGRNVDVFATDACSMQMIEIAAEISDYADYFVASETAIPDQGWPYDTWLAQWVAAGPAADPKLVASFISSQFLTAYSAGGEYAKQRDQDTTQSYLHLVHIKSTLDAIQSLGSLIVGFNETDRQSAFKAVTQSVCFSEPDSCDVVSFANLVAQAVARPELQQAVVRLDAAVHLLVAQHGGTGQFENNVSGLAIWLPATTDIYYLFDHNTRYETLKFEQYTQWGQALRYMLLGNQ